MSSSAFGTAIPNLATENILNKLDRKSLAALYISSRDGRTEISQFSPYISSYIELWKKFDDNQSLYFILMSDDTNDGMKLIAVMDDVCFDLTTKELFSHSQLRTEPPRFNPSPLLNMMLHAYTLDHLIDMYRLQGDTPDKISVTTMIGKLASIFKDTKPLPLLFHDLSSVALEGCQQLLK